MAINSGKLFCTISLTLLAGCGSFRDENTVRIDPGIFHKKPPVQQYATYTAEGGETLINVAFQMYSDYTKWKDIEQENQDALAGIKKLPAGLELKLPKPINPYSPPEGSKPYVVKSLEYLGEISTKLYGSKKYAGALYEFNKGIMSSPDKIFAGSTIYYPPDPKKLNE